MRSPASASPVRCCAPLVSRKLKDTEAVATAQIFKSLSDPHRVRIVNLLANADGPVCVCDITAEIGLSQPTISFHLKRLVGAGLLKKERRGTWGYYSIDGRAMGRLANVMKGVEG